MESIWEWPETSHLVQLKYNRIYRASAGGKKNRGSALQVFELDVVDYWIKVIRLECFLKAINKTKEIHDLINAVEPSTGKEILPGRIYKASFINAAIKTNWVKRR